MKKKKSKLIQMVFVVVILCIGLGVFSFESKIKAYEIISKKDFRLTAENKWDETKKKSYVQLDWGDDFTSDLSSSGYQLYQSEDGSTWKGTSLKYNEPISVLNIYPDVPNSNTLKTWMDDLGLQTSEGQKLINVTAVSLDTYNADPDAYLKDLSGNYQYDVLMFGSWDWNNFLDLTSTSVTATKAFSDTGRGILFGHDTITGSYTTNFHTNFNIFGTEMELKLFNGSSLGSSKVRIVNNGYMMKYPYELKDSVTLNIPLSHSWGEQFDRESSGTIWLEFVPPFTFGSLLDDGRYTNNFYLMTKDNLAKIQTGHSNGESKPDEQKIIANTLYNLAQVSMDNFAQDYTVKDDVPPEIPSVKLKCGTKDQFSVHIRSNDKGKKYQWYVTADTKTVGNKTSDIVEEEVISDIQGYIYTVDNSATTVPTVTKDEYGNVTNLNASVELPNRTASVYGIDAKNNKYMHVVAVDRANNVSEVQHVELATIDHYVDYEIERIGDEAKLVELELDSGIDNKMQSIEIQIPQNTEIKDFSSLTLPTGWFSYQNSDPNPAYQSFGFSMTTSNNDITTIQNFLESLRFAISSPTDQQGNIRVVFHEKLLASWNEHPDGKIHYYSFFPGQVTWQEAYNAAKESTYKGMAGYLATTTSFEEHSFIYNAIAKNPGWLGGSRMIIKEPASKINDEKVISKNQEDYDSSSNITWYWTNGPESGLVFYTGKTAKGGGFTPTGVYSGWDKRTPEPNNNWWNISEEYVLQFASQGSMYWNDLPSWIVNEPNWIQGYYVEYSEYGDQVEGEEDTDLCWSAPIPQKVSLKAYDEEGASVSEGDILYDQELRIGKEITVTPTVLAMYDFKELRNVDDTLHNPMVYTVEDTLQEGKLIYTNRKVSIHIRQVVTDPNAKVVVPTSGYGTIYSKATAGGTGVQNFPVDVGGDQSEATQVFSDYVIRSRATEKYFSYEAILPEYYQLLGYVVSTEVPVSGTSTEHKVANASTTVPTVDISENAEFWITTYITPTTETPSFYGWGYGQSEKYQTVE